MAEKQMLVLTNPMPGREADFNHWYDDVHLPDVLRVPGVTGGRRFKVLLENEWRYAAIYDLDTDDPEALMQELERRVTDGRIGMSDALDPDSIKMCIIAPLAH